MLTASVPITNSGTDLQPAADTVAGLLDSSTSLDDKLPCRQDPDLWFAENPRELDQAKTLCAECPIRAECLAGALSRAEPWGVWGGEIFERGEVVARKRPRGRPRKHPLPADKPVATPSRRQEQAA
ncbi:WhiB family transcriptional regulator, redox-sensing transcriptional regulator [Saccharopolyspora kobensis]|uniref:Transcriptional regulator WhiB n=1 Tax=Saccharopolyspora kobensis TaxID=146035 RepID=A0A1H6CWD1_9PSEU|nr:WhiB family transcriptional regulator [Saccharopolyspora kobensis]SEG77331.1 WhiB family transcriptional regulator, redox-sensing transcriptional regulator [Saccharopolyspora kobensis]SFD02024.1 WhiB family transcriptional regulator, redox-sensing transcriptional regulator [Saccharopolyspora kobensis]